MEDCNDTPAIYEDLRSEELVLEAHGNEYRSLVQLYKALGGDPDSLPCPDFTFKIPHLVADLSRRSVLEDQMPNLLFKVGLPVKSRAKAKSFVRPPKEDWER